MKKIWILIAAVVWLGGCYLIGQYRYPDKGEQLVQTEQPQDEDGNQSVWSTFDLEFEGSEKTSDNPWGYTAGIIDTDFAGECILLNPNTSVTFNISEDLDSFNLAFEIHPWVAESSDGAGINIWFMDSNDDILRKESFLVSDEDTWNDISYTMQDLNGAKKIKILCNNGEKDDDSADWLILKFNDIFPSEFGKEEYVRSVTYFSDEWPINFWNSEMDNLENDFIQICNDGFESIIIVIPWKEFQTSISPISYNDYAFDKLEEVIETANKYNLDVYARIGYSWDYYNDLNESISERFLDLLRDENTYNAWLDYAKVMYGELGKHSNFKEAFITWEDFWGNLAICDCIDETTRLDYAKEIGYQDWVAKYYGIDNYNEMYLCNYTNSEQIPVPLRNEPEMEAMYMFYDEFLNRLLRDTQNVFPNISMEVRLDADLVTTVSNEQKFYSHSATYKCENSDYTATMYGIPMGFENDGERVSAKDAMQHTEYILGDLFAQNDGKPIYVEQFLFLDNTPQFSHNAQIKEEEVGNYLEDISIILKKFTKGYGIWTYRDYRNNMLYNSQFALELLGWDYTDDVSCVKDNEGESYSCEIKKGGRLGQQIPLVRNHFDSNIYKVRFEVTKVDENAKAKIKLGNKEQELVIDKSGLYEIQFEKSNNFDFDFSLLSGDIFIDNICIYSFVQEGQLYDVNNNESDYIRNIRVLNEELRNEVQCKE